MNLKLEINWKELKKRVTLLPPVVVVVIVVVGGAVVVNRPPHWPAHVAGHNESVN